jgi:hypothetical protein
VPGWGSLTGRSARGRAVTPAARRRFGLWDVALAVDGLGERWCGFRPGQLLVVAGDGVGGELQARWVSVRVSVRVAVTTSAV